MDEKVKKFAADLLDWLQTEMDETRKRVPVSDREIDRWMKRERLSLYHKVWDKVVEALKAKSMEDKT